jgi:hypothetical protein
MYNKRACFNLSIALTSELGSSVALEIDYERLHLAQ